MADRVRGDRDQGSEFLGAEESIVDGNEFSCFNLKIRKRPPYQGGSFMDLKKFRTYQVVIFCDEIASDRFAALAMTVVVGGHGLEPWTYGL
jgi:hypothetical protein